MASGVNNDPLDSNRMKRAMKRAKEAERMVEEESENTRRHRTKHSTQTRKHVEASSQVVATPSQVVAIPSHYTRSQQKAQTGNYSQTFVGGISITFENEVKNVQIGNYNSMFINETPPAQTSARHQSEKNDIKPLTEQQKVRYDALLSCSEEVPQKMMLDLARSWNRKWRSYGRHLGLTDVCLENIYDNHSKEGIEEVCFQVLKSWKEKSDDLSVCNLISLLTADKEYNSIMVLLGNNSE